MVFTVFFLYRVCAGMHANGSECYIPLPSNGWLRGYMPFFLSNSHFAHAGRSFRWSRCCSSMLLPLDHPVCLFEHCVVLCWIGCAKTSSNNLGVGWLSWQSWFLKWLLAAGRGCRWNWRSNEEHQTLQHFRYLLHALSSQSAPCQPAGRSSTTFEISCVRMSIKCLLCLSKH